MQTEPDITSPQFLITPEPARVDEMVAIRLVHLAPAQLITIRTIAYDETGRGWFSWATFCADKSGMVDVSELRPLAGSYVECDAMGLFWSLQPLTSEPQYAYVPFKHSSLAPLAYEFSAESENKCIATTRHERFFQADHQIVRYPLHENGLVGTLFYPIEPGPYSCVLLFSGSSGTVREQDAALLAMHGYAALALAYSGVASLPRYSQEIPLEYFARAISWLRASEIVANQKIAAMGISKGAELALLLGATFPEIAAVVAYAPSAYVYQGLGRGITSSWSYRGQPLPFVASEPAPIFELYEQQQLAEGAPIACCGGYLESLQHTSELEQAVIPVECIRGPILLISGEDDQMWPSMLFAELIEQRLLEHEYPYWHQHLSYAGAGHKIGLPNLPSTVIQARHQVSGIINDYGGTPQGNAQASRQSWQTLLDFLKQHLY